jgi:DHA1 family inner membrane transport protein
MVVAERTRWGIVFLALAAGIVSALHLGKAPPALPLMRPELGLGLISAGWVVTTFNFLALTIGMVTGVFADAMGRYRLLLIGLATLVAGGLLGSMAGGTVVILASRFVEGLGFVAIIVAAPSLIGEAAAPGDRRLALGIWSTYMPTGIALGMVVAPHLLAPFGWRGLWLAVAALAVALLAIGLLFRGGQAPVPPAPAGPAETPWRNIRLTVSRPGPWLLAGSFASITLPWSGISVWLPTFLIEEWGSSLIGAGALTALFVIFNAVGNLSCAWLMHRGVARWILIAAPSVINAALAFGIFSEALADPLRYGLCLAFSASGGFITATVLAGGPLHAPSPRQLGTTNGLLVQGTNFGFFLGAPAVATAVAIGGTWQATQWVILACAAAGLAMALTLRGIERRLTGF